MSAHQNPKPSRAKGQPARRADDPAALMALLTPAEHGILHWVCEGKSSPAIAIILSRSQRTVDNHIGSILRKFRVETRWAAARIAFDHEQLQASSRRASARRRKPKR